MTPARKLTPEKAKELVNRCVSGEKAAWDEFVEQFSNLIYSSIHKTIRKYGFQVEPDRVNELYQDVFVSLCQNDFSKLKAFRWECSLASWIVPVAIWVTKDFIRKDAKDKNRTLSINAEHEATDEVESSGSLSDILSDEKTRPDRETTSREEVGLIRKGLTELPPQDQKLLELLIEEEWKAEDVARLLNKTVAAVYMQKTRALDKLKQCLQKKGVSF